MATSRADELVGFPLCLGHLVKLPALLRVEWFIRAALRENPDTLRRARLLVLGCFGSAALGMVSNAARRGAVAEYPEATLAVLIGAVAWALVPFVLRVSGSLRVASALPAGIGLAIVTTVAYYEGGPHAPVLMFAALVPIVAVFLQGARAGVAYAAVTTLVLGAIVALDAAGHEFPDVGEQAESFHIVRPMITGAVTVMATFFAVLYEQQRLRAQAELEASSERYALAASAASDGFFDWDIAADVTVYAERASELLRRSGRFGPSQSPFSPQLVAVEDQERVSAELERHLADGERLDIECRLETGSGQRWFEITGLTLRDDDGQPRRMVGAIRDISDRKEIERLEDEFVATVSHELRTPLTSIQGAIGLLRGGISGDLSAQGKELVELAYRNVETLVLLVNDLLDLQKVEDRSLALQLDEIDMNQLAEDAIRANKTLQEVFGVEFTLAERASGARVRGDPRRLQQVLTNLMANAAKYSSSSDRVEVSVSVEADVVRCAVADHGPGIPDSFREHVFERFAQADGSATREHGGTGLGLSIAKAIVELHGGMIGFDSEVGRGTTFFFDLPAAGSGSRSDGV